MTNKDHAKAIILCAHGSKEKKYEVHWIICTEINNKHSAFLRKKYQNRRYEIKKVQKKLNISKVHKLNFPSAMLYQLDKGQIILKISHYLLRHQIVSINKILILV